MNTIEVVMTSNEYACQTDHSEKVMFRICVLRRVVCNLNFPIFLLIKILSVIFIILFNMEIILLNLKHDLNK